MAVIGPAELPVVLQVDSNPMKSYVLSMLGNPVVEVEVMENQFETVLRNTGDFIAHYFPKQQRLAYFYTIPLQSTYDLPKDAYWIQEVQWDPVTTNIGDIFGAESFLFNIGNITGIQNLLLDYTLLQQYRRFSQRILGTEGHWEVLGDRKIRLYPTPKGAFPVLVLYIPPVTTFNTPICKKLALDMLLAESMIMLGNARSKFSGIPSPDGGSLSMNGDALVSRGEKMRDEIVDQANLLAEPLGIFRF